MVAQRASATIATQEASVPWESKLVSVSEATKQK